METAVTSGLRGGLFGLSAHSDDLGFSLGAALMDGRLPGCRPVTVFSRSRYTLRVPDGNESNVSLLRKSEDRAFFSRTATGAPLWLDQPDAPVRRDLGAESVFSASMRPEELATTSAALGAVIPSHGVLLAPMALGGHIDHRLVRNAACELYRQGNYDLWFYEDLPYAAFMAVSAIEDAVTALQQQLGTRLCPRYWPSPSLPQAKQWAVESYASQTDEGSLRALLHHAARLQQAGVPAERVWYPCR